jgi:hypothetical protein
VRREKFSRRLRHEEVKLKLVYLVRQNEDPVLLHLAVVNVTHNHLSASNHV